VATAGGFGGPTGALDRAAGGGAAGGFGRVPASFDGWAGFGAESA
jgi:hypothetical protein